MRNMKKRIKYLQSKDTSKHLYLMTMGSVKNSITRIILDEVRTWVFPTRIWNIFDE